uniref:Uncharacterized protein n=1 Tax=Caldicellulosiruptor owensensis TaxID=55205 RepID=A0A7C5Z8N4_9FIRM
MLIVETKLCSACGSPNVGLEVSEDTFGFSLMNKNVVREKLYHDDVYCFCCSDYRRSVDGYLVFHNGKLFTIREYFDDYEIVEIPYEQCGHVLFFERSVLPRSSW